MKNKISIFGMIMFVVGIALLASSLYYSGASFTIIGILYLLLGGIQQKKGKNDRNL